MSTQSPDLSNAIDKISKEIDESVERIAKMADIKEKRSSRQYGWDVGLRATTAILAVASPALVTYSTMTGVRDSYKLAAILLSALAGASATLQTIFALHENYVRNGIDALDLHEIKAQLESDRQEALQKGADFERYAALKVAHSKATGSQKEIAIKKQRAYLETKLGK